MLTRTEGWERRLITLLREARGWSYRQGHCDCMTLACRGVQALTGVDLWPRWAGRYDDRRGALRVMAETANRRPPYLQHAITAVLGVDPVPPALLRRGDLLLWQEHDGPHVGLVMGAEAAGFGPGGIYAVAVRSGRHGWRVG